MKMTLFAVNRAVTLAPPRLLVGVTCSSRDWMSLLSPPRPADLSHSVGGCPQGTASDQSLASSRSYVL